MQNILNLFHLNERQQNYFWNLWWYSNNTVDNNEKNIFCCTMSHFNFHNVAAETSELFPQVRFERRTWILNLPSLLMKSISSLICRFLIWSKQSQKTQNATGNLNSLRCFGRPSIKHLLNKCNALFYVCLNLVRDSWGHAADWSLVSNSL